MASLKLRLRLIKQAGNLLEGRGALQDGEEGWGRDLEQLRNSGN